MKYKDILIRAIKTFVQAFLGATFVFTQDFANVTDVETAKKVLISMGIAGLSAGISAVWNYLLKITEV